MNTYIGPATLIVGDEASEVQADLWGEQDGAFKKWAGHLQPTNQLTESAGWTAFNDGAILRLPDGRQADVSLEDCGSSIRVTGRGTPPF